MSMTTEQQRLFTHFTTKPNWMKEAVLTKRGWVNPKTGELLLGRRTPDWVMEELERQTQSKTVEPQKVEIAVEEALAPEEKSEAPAEETKAEEKAEEKVEEKVEQPVETPKRRGGRTKKVAGE